MTDIRGCREETVEGETGFLVPVKDAGALADRLLLLLREPERARRMGEAARRRARALYDERQVLGRQWRVLAGLAEQRGLPPPSVGRELAAR
jgi:glycosyltransferase involved in cell wall biosynthesis